MGHLTTDIDSAVSDNIVEDITIPAVVNFPVVVEESLGRLGHLFPSEPERRHFGEYLTGLITTHKKNVSAISAANQMRLYVNGQQAELFRNWRHEHEKVYCIQYDSSAGAGFPGPVGACGVLSL